MIHEWGLVLRNISAQRLLSHWNIPVGMYGMLKVKPYVSGEPDARTLVPAWNLAIRLVGMLSWLLRGLSSDCYRQRNTRDIRFRKARTFALTLEGNVRQGLPR
jgi:hypothetical protein